MDSRAAFEAWISAPPYKRSIVRFPDAPSGSPRPSEYIQGPVQMAWHAWQARDAEVEALRSALIVCARKAEALKRPCGNDPESEQAVRNAQYQDISTTAHIALGTIRGPALAAGRGE